MKPGDPRVRRQLDVARRPLAVVVGSGMAASLLLVGQAFALTYVVVAAVRSEDLLGPLLGLAVVVVLKVINSVVGDLAAARAAALVSSDMRQRIACAVLEGHVGDVSEGEIASLATRGVSAAEPYLTRYLPTLVLAGVLPVLTVLVIATQDLISAGIVVATIPLIPVFGALVGLATRDRAEAQWRAMASLSGHFVDVMKGLPTLVAFRRAEAQAGTIRAVTNRYRDATLKTLRIAFASSAVLELVATISVALVAVVVGVRLAAGGMDLSTALVVLLLAPEAYWPLRRVGAEFHAAAEGVATFEKMSDFIDAAPSSAVAVAGVKAGIDSHALVAEAVSFIYPGRREESLTGLDLEIPPLGLLAVTGPSGAGKSTLLGLLAGLITPTTGAISIGGLPTTDPAWQEQVSWLPQRPTVLTGTVAENLRLGAPGASERVLWAALDKVALAERIRHLGGLDAAVAEDGANLSAGERARLALARVVVADRPWVLLDEPTAHLDPITTKVLLDVIVDLSRTATVVVVAHDPAVVALADRVVALGAAGAASVGGSVDTTVPEPDPVPAPLVSPQTGAEDLSRARFALSTALGVLASLSGVALTATAGWLIVKASEQPATLTLLVAIVAVRTFGLGRPVFRYAERLRSHDAALRLLAERRVGIYEAVVPLTPGRLGKRRGDVLTALVDDVDAVVDRELRVRLPLRTYAAVVVATAAVASLILPAAALVIAATSVTGALLAYLIARFGSRLPEAESVASRAEMSAAMLDAAHLAPELHMWQAADVVLRPVHVLSNTLGRCTRSVATALATSRAVVHLSALLGVAGVALVGRSGLDQGAVSAPALALLLLVPIALTEVALGVVEAGGLVAHVNAAQARLDIYREMAPAVVESAEPAPEPSRHHLVAEHASFGWAGSGVLNDLNLVVEEGAKLGIIGPSGSGKSTLAAGLIRFIDPLQGSVELGGSALPTLALATVRGSIGYVDDDPHVFASTLLENIRLARPEANETEVRAALSKARLGSWVDSLPNGLQTMLGDGHAQVSGGERARIGLARSLLLDQPVLVLDEPVAHLDSGTAQQLAADLLDATSDRTVVWITHSQVGLERMDRILDLGGCTDAADLSGLNHG